MFLSHFHLTIDLIIANISQDLKFFKGTSMKVISFDTDVKQI